MHGIVALYDSSPQFIPVLNGNSFSEAAERRAFCAKAIFRCISLWWGYLSIALTIIAAKCKLIKIEHSFILEMTHCTYSSMMTYASLQKGNTNLENYWSVINQLSMRCGKSR